MLHHKDKLEDWKERLADKKNLLGEKKLDAKYWDKIKEKLKHDPKFFKTPKDQAESYYMKRQHELNEKREEILSKQPKEIADRLRDMKERGEALRMHMDEKRAKLAKKHAESKDHKMTTIKNMAEFGDVNYWRHLREHHEQQHEFNAMQALFALFFLIAANFLVIQTCSWSSQEKGRRDL